jgi:hypothetical protein
MICPYDCSPCTDPSCRQDGCKQTDAMMHVICSGCGDPVVRVNCVHLCVTCVLTSEQPLRKKSFKKSLR